MLCGTVSWLEVYGRYLLDGDLSRQGTSTDAGAFHGCECNIAASCPNSALAHTGEYDNDSWYLSPNGDKERIASPAKPQKVDDLALSARHEALESVYGVQTFFTRSYWEHIQTVCRDNVMPPDASGCFVDVRPYRGGSLVLR